MRTSPSAEPMVKGVPGATEDARDECAYDATEMDSPSSYFVAMMRSCSLGMDPGPDESPLRENFAETFSASS